MCGTGDPRGAPPRKTTTPSRFARRGENAMAPRCAAPARFHALPRGCGNRPRRATWLPTALRGPWRNGPLSPLRVGYSCGTAPDFHRLRRGEPFRASPRPSHPGAGAPRPTSPMMKFCPTLILPPLFIPSRRGHACPRGFQNPTKAAKNRHLFSRRPREHNEIFGLPQQIHCILRDSIG